MKYNIILEIDNGEKEFDFLIGQNKNIIEICIKTNENKKLKEIFTIELLEEYKKQYIEETNEYMINIIEKIKQLIKENTIIKNATEIYINSEKESINFINNNEILKEKKLILKEYWSLSSSNYDYIKESFPEKTYIQILGNTYPITLETYKKINESIDKMVSTIKKYNLSPIEQVMFAYDIIRKRKYNEETEKESFTLSRDISKVLEGDKIVCVGYANLFNAVLEKLEIKSDLYAIKLKNNNSGHIRNIAHIIDKKYNIDGIYFFDLTWDSKKKGNKYLDSYRYFCNSKNEIERFDKKYIDNTLQNLNNTFFYEVIKTLEEKGLEGLEKEQIETINYISLLIEQREIIDKIITSKFYKILIEKGIIRKIEDICNINILKQKLEKYDELLFNNELDPVTLVEILYNTRKIEALEEEKYKFDKETIKEIIKNSLWLTEPTNEQRLFEAIFGKKMISNPAPKEQIEEFIDNYEKKEELEKNIEQTKLIKVLKNVYNKKI